MFEKGKKVGIIVGMASVVVMAAVPCFATAVADYTAIGTSITSELTPALATAIPIAGTLIAVRVGWKMVKRFCA